MALNILLVTIMLNPLDLYIFFFLKWIHIEELLIKQNVSFLMKDEKIFNRNIMNFWKKFSSIMIKEFNGKNGMQWKISKKSVVTKEKSTQIFTIKK